MPKKLKPSPKLISMPEWRDGQPGCKKCLKELEVGARVFLSPGFLYYCAACAVKVAK
jgi:hypothetical protein